MARKRFHGLKKVKIRASWNKYNLYNLSRFKPPNTSFQTYYQQKWSAKSLARAYHGEQIREKQWQRMFTPKFNSVVPMDHRYLAENDGSEMAAGRGSGLEKDIPQAKIADIRSARKQNLTPYMHMTFAPIERRLDMAIFRALFASSARQARQFVVHGKVKVNGKKMIYPGYLLNPGDMYQVDVESVLFATGAPKTTEQRKMGRIRIRGIRNRNVSLARLRAAGLEKRAAAKAEKEDSKKLAKPKRPVMQDSLEERKTARAEILQIIESATDFLIKNKKWMKSSAVKRQKVRSFRRTAKNFLGRIYRLPIETLNQERTELTTTWKDFIKQDPRWVAYLEKQKNVKAEPESESSEESQDGGLKIIRKREREFETKAQKLAKEMIARAGLAQARENPIDPSKPYATPWKPRPFMSAFAFIPRYLEVNHKICSAVYLRHPVARPGLAEVPTPFPLETAQLAFNWYLRRR